MAFNWSEWQAGIKARAQAMPKASPAELAKRNIGSSSPKVTTSSGSSGSSGGGFWSGITDAVKNIGNIVTGVGGGSVPTVAQPPPTMPPIVPPTVPTVAQPTQTLNEKDLRRQQKANFTGWDNIPEARALQMRSWDIYIETGRWDSPAQRDLNEQADDIRRSSNPTYDGGFPYGPSNPGEAGQIALPPNTSGLGGLFTGALSGAGAILPLGLIALVILIFRR